MNGNGTPTTTDFHLSFALAGLIALLSALVFRRLDPAAGAEVSGHHRAPVKLDAGGA